MNPGMCCGRHRVLGPGGRICVEAWGAVWLECNTGCAGGVSLKVLHNGDACVCGVQGSGWAGVGAGGWCVAPLWPDRAVCRVARAGVACTVPGSASVSLHLLQMGQAGQDDLCCEIMCL